MNNSGIIKTLDIRKENMEQSWEISDKFVKDLEKSYDEKKDEYKWPKMTGALQAKLASIMIGLSVYHPEACKFVAETRFNQEV